MTEHITLFKRIAWDRLLIWIAFLAILYTLRHFFFVIFLTFIVTYCMRSIIERFYRKLPVESQTRMSELLITVLCFLGLLLGTYGVGAYLAPKFVQQGQEFVRKVANPKKSPKAQLDDLLRDSLGKWLFSQRYGDPTSEAYQSALVASGESDRFIFEQNERTRLVTEWRQGDAAERIEEKIEEQLVGVMGRAGAVVGNLIPKLLYLPFEILLVLLLSFFISVDIPKMRQGIRKLRDSRVRFIYDEISPGLISFGRLIGRSFAAQGKIAALNTLFTYFLCIWLLDIQHGVFLSVVVFICSFIPVVGVVLSGLPITLVAITQEGGSILLGLEAIGLILIIHFIETGIFNPRILGSMLHLHPVLVLAILAIGEHFFGVWGLLLGVPVAVYIIRFLILDEGIPGVIEPIRRVSA
jgi:predicted PurR-regulated permease PerM